VCSLIKEMSFRNLTATTIVHKKGETITLILDTFTTVFISSMTAASKAAMKSKTSKTE
jgi:hypothetical protein